LFTTQLLWLAHYFLRLALHDDRTEAALAELASDENVALDVEAAERYETLLKTVQAALTPSEWALFEDHYIRGLSNQEIAKNLGITPHALEQRRSRLKKKLRSILSNPSDKHSYHGNII
jgi:RNA polymerase sigma factor (sigma-70 family)